MGTSRVISRYARSLLELALENKVLEEVEKDIDHIKTCLANKDLYLFLKSPIIKSGVKKTILIKIFKSSVGKLTMSFIEIIVRKGRENMLAEIVFDFIKQCKEYRGISTVKLKTAVPLSKELISAIRKILEESSITRKVIDLEVETNPELIGGFILEFDDKLMDSSIAHKLDQLKRKYSFQL